MSLLAERMNLTRSINSFATSSFSFLLRSPFLPQLFLKDLQQWQGQVDETNALADKLLTLYASDDTHKVTQVNNNMVTSWTHIRKR